jgi:DNA-binding LacI/PurR family transcriptional regulator
MASTIRDVARLAGVGSGTVSRVINNSPKVDPGTRAKVLQAIAELDFHPSAMARRLSIGKTSSVGVVVPFMTRPSVIERLRGIEGALSTTGYDLVVFNVETLERRNDVLAGLLRGDRVDGLILVGLSPTDAEVATLRNSGLATVLVDAYHPGLSRVVVNDVAGGRLATRHLLDLGHRRIAFLGGLPRVAFSFSASRLRQRGVRSALRAEGLDLPARYTILGDHGRARARELVRAALRADRPPTAIACASDTLALGALEAARDVGLEVPTQLSVIGYDDLEIAGYLGLTTIRQPLFESGVQGVRMLVARMATPPARPTREVLEVELVRRSTTGPPPEERADRARRTRDSAGVTAARSPAAEAPQSSS